MPIKLGDKAPDFTLVDSDIKPWTLSQHLSKKTVLAFFPGAFTNVCQKELCTFRNWLQEFKALNAQVVGISVDAPFSNKAFATQNELNFALLSDYERKVSNAYGGVHNDFAGMTGYSASKRAVYVVDIDGSIKYAWLSENPGQEPPYEEVKHALA